LLVANASSPSTPLPPLLPGSTWLILLLPVIG
jgi:hypothetical protein